MTPKEIATELAAIKRSVGPRADVYISVDCDANPVHVGLYPYGLTKGDGYLTVRGDDFAGTLNAMRAKWEEHRDAFVKVITRKMALAIIRETDEFGRCTDAALRNEFDAGQVAAYGAAACELADTMAGKGPFTITALAGANAA